MQILIWQALRMFYIKRDDEFGLYDERGSFKQDRFLALIERSLSLSMSSSSASIISFWKNQGRIDERPAYYLIRMAQKAV